MVCPSCGSSRVVSDGTRNLSSGLTVQRFKCKQCFHRFTDPTVLKTVSDNRGNGQVCVTETKNLTAQQDLETVCAGDSNLIEYAWRQLKAGNSEATIRQRVNILQIIQRKGGNLSNPETVTTLLATELLTKAQKYSWTAHYRSYTKTMKLSWDPPRVRYQPKEPFLPTREEIEILVHSANKRLATFLQTLKTTGGRAGEICKLKWTDINTEKNTVSINDAEKNSRNRTIKVPAKTIAMINALNKRYEPYIFNPNPDTSRANFTNLRNRLAKIHQNPRLKQIHLHTFRHFFATEKLKQTKQLTYVQYLLGHKSVINTERYTHMTDFNSDQYYSAVANTVEEGRKLAEDGWTYFQTFEGVKVFRKLK